MSNLIPVRAAALMIAAAFAAPPAFAEAVKIAQIGPLAASGQAHVATQPTSCQIKRPAR